MPRFTIKFTSRDNNGHFKPMTVRRRFRNHDYAFEWVKQQNEQDKMDVVGEVEVTHRGDTKTYEL